MFSTALLYLVTVGIWGTTWIALKFQIGPVPIPWSIAYRFWCAALLVFIWQALRRRWRPPAREVWGLLAAQGLTLFCLNFIFLLHASRWIASGLVAVCFATAPLWNALLARGIRGTPLKAAVLVGGAVGVAGLILLSGTEMLRAPHWTPTLLGIALALAGTLCFSVGNLLSSAIQQRGYSPMQTNAWGMLAGATFVAIYALASGQPVAVDRSWRYLAALMYLVLPGSLVGFNTYLALVGRLGADKAGYCTVLFPLVALNVSVWQEGYTWTIPGLLGVLLVLTGNVIVFWPAGAVRRPME